MPFHLGLATLIPVTAPSGLLLSIVELVTLGLGWTQLCREVRSKTLVLPRARDMRAALALGARDRRITTPHILPDVLSHVIGAITLGKPGTILLEGVVGFLGVAVKSPLMSWG